MKRTREAIESVVKKFGLTQIGEMQWNQLRASLPGVSETVLRKHLIEMKVSVEQPWRGLDTASLDSLEQTLREMAEVYQTHPRPARDVVIAAKDKARFASRNAKAAPEKRALKSEMVEWMLVWLGDPGMFSDWAGLRRAILKNQSQTNPAKPNPP